MPYLELHDDGYVELHEGLPTLVTATLLALLRGYWLRSRIYGEGGEMWRVMPAPTAIPRPSLLLRLLVNTVYNPIRSVPVVCERAGDYGLSELKARITSYVARDDDILTQFMEASEIQSELGRAETFRDIVALVKRMQGADEVAQQGDGADERCRG